MSLYLLLKGVHLAAAALYIGVSVANGYAKTRGDRHRDATAAALALDLVAAQNRVFLLPASVVLLATGWGMAQLASLPLTQGWLAHALIVFAGLSVMLTLAVRMESRLLALAEEARHKGTALPALYWQLSRRWSQLGAVATLTLGLMLATMVGRRSLLPW